MLRKRGEGKEVDRGENGGAGEWTVGREENRIQHWNKGSFFSGGDRGDKNKNQKFIRIFLSRTWIGDRIVLSVTYILGPVCAHA
jgi:hypothetical protein